MHASPSIIDPTLNHAASRGAPLPMLRTVLSEKNRCFTCMRERTQSRGESLPSGDLPFHGRRSSGTAKETIMCAEEVDTSGEYNADEVAVTVAGVAITKGEGATGAFVHIGREVPGVRSRQAPTAPSR